MTINEAELKNFPKPIFYEQTKSILKQMTTCICKVNVDGDRGTGFFTKVLINDKLVPVFITNNHVISKDYLDTKIEIEINIYDDPKKIQIEDKVFITNQEYDVTIIEINEEKEQILDYLELDENIFCENKINEYLGNSVYILQYPSYHDIQKLAVSYGIIKGRDEKQKYNFNHFCSTEYASSGSPILNINNNKIIGIHTKRSDTHNYNFGTFLFYALKEFIEAYKSKYFNKMNIIDSISNKNKNNDKNDINNIDIKRNIIPYNRKNSPPNIIKKDELNIHKVIQPNIKKNVSPNFQKKIQPNIKNVIHNIQKVEVQPIIKNKEIKPIIQKKICQLFKKQFSQIFKKNLS